MLFVDSTKIFSYLLTNSNMDSNNSQDQASELSVRRLCSIFVWKKKLPIILDSLQLYTPQEAQYQPHPDHAQSNTTHTTMELEN
jgi:hypothetical protein